LATGNLVLNFGNQAMQNSQKRSIKKRPTTNWLPLL